MLASTNYIKSLIKDIHTNLVERGVARFSPTKH